jgi:hypothetical protein
VSITKTSDLAAQWKSVSADVVKALADEDVASIKINCGNYALDNEELAIPDPFNGKAAGKTINVVFSGSFKSKTVKDVEQALNVTLGKLAGADVNIFLPGDEFKMVLDATGTKTAMFADSLGATTLKTLYAKADAVKKNALTIDDEVIVSGISMDGALVGSADNILAKLVAGTESLEKGKGATVGKKDIGAVYVKNLILTGNTSVSGADETALKTVVIPENVTLTLAAKKSQVESIVGLGTAKKPSTVDLAGGDKDDLTKIGSIENVIITGTTTAVNVADFDIFENVIFDLPVNLYTSAANTEFLKNVNVKFEDDVEKIAFANVNFGGKTVMTVSGASKTTSKMKSVAMYQWDKTAKNYVEIDDEKDVYETNTDYVEIVQAVYTAKAYATAMAKDSLVMKAGKFTFPDLEAANKKLEAKVKAYNEKIESDGLETANGGKGIADAYASYSSEVQAYIDAYEEVNGVCDYTIYSKDSDGNYLDKDGKITTTPANYVQVKLQISKKKNQGAKVGLAGSSANAFMTAVNAKIGDADWFEIFYATEITTTPEDVTVSFDEDCTIGDAAITLKKLNKMINVDGDGYASWKEIFFDVEYDGETYQWAGDATNGFYLK